MQSAELIDNMGGKEEALRRPSDAGHTLHDYIFEEVHLAPNVSSSVIRFLAQII